MRLTVEKLLEVLKDADPKAVVWCGLNSGAIVPLEEDVDFPTFSPDNKPVVLFEEGE